MIEAMMNEPRGVALKSVCVSQAFLGYRLPRGKACR